MRQLTLIILAFALATTTLVNDAEAKKQPKPPKLSKSQKAQTQAVQESFSRPCVVQGIDYCGMAIATSEPGCHVAVAELLYFSSVDMIVDISETDCNALQTSTGTPLYIPQTIRDQNEALLFLTNPFDYSISYAGSPRFSGYTSGVSTDAAIKVLRAIDLYAATFNGIIPSLVKGTFRY